MNEGKQARAPSDAELVAYLDGELSPADSVRIDQQLASDDSLKGRMRNLTRGGRPFAQSFEPLLAQAPSDRLEAMVADALRRPAATLTRWHSATRYGMVAATAAVVLLAGAGLDRLEMMHRPTASLSAAMPDDESTEWRKTVAQYLALYTRETLSMIPGSTADRREELARLGDRLGLTLSPDSVALPDFALKRADLYDYDGKALAFLAYLAPDLGQVALCIMPGDGSEAARVERRQDMNIVYWSKGGHSFMLVGRTPADRLQALATDVQGRFGSRG